MAIQGGSCKWLITFRRIATSKRWSDVVVCPVSELGAELAEIEKTDSSKVEKIKRIKGLQR